MSKTAENFDWESIRSKYVDICELLKAQLPLSPEAAVEMGKDYSHSEDNITQQVVTSKLSCSLHCTI